MLKLALSNGMCNAENVYRGGTSGAAAFAVWGCMFMRRQQQYYCWDFAQWLVNTLIGNRKAGSAD